MQALRLAPHHAAKGTKAANIEKYASTDGSIEWILHAWSLLQRTKFITSTSLERCFSVEHTIAGQEKPTVRNTLKYSYDDFL